MPYFLKAANIHSRICVSKSEILAAKKHPRETAQSTPNIKCIEEIKELLEQSVIHRHQSALKDLVSF